MGTKPQPFLLSQLSLQLLTLWLLLLPAVGQAQFNYTTNNGTITITKYTGSGGTVIIPSTINGLPVVSIENLAFYSRSSVTNITIPNSVTNCGTFFGCYNLTTITIDSLNDFYSSVDGVLFNKSQTMLMRFPEGKAGNYTIPNSVTGMRDEAFVYCYSLTSVTMPNSVTNIGKQAFHFCSSLTNITIPNSVTSIGVLAFYQCSSLTSVIIPNSVISIGDGVFFGCHRLASVTMPDNITSIGVYAFYDCYDLTNVTIPESVTSIEREAFFYCSSLTSITIPNNVTNIGNQAFSRCHSLTNIAIPTNVTSIGEESFYECRSLTNVMIPSSVTNIGNGAFDDCSSLTVITVNVLNDFYSSADGVLFNKSQTTLIRFPGGKAGSYTVPNSVTNIGRYAFGSCYSLASATIPNNVTSIGLHAFRYCANLTAVYFCGHAPSTEEVFTGANNATVYYLPGTIGWTSTFADRPTALWKPLVQSRDASFGVRTNQFGFNISWANSQTIIVETSTTLTNPTWSPLQTNTLTDSSFYFTDPQWTNYLNRFYRLRSP